MSEENNQPKATESTEPVKEEPKKEIMFLTMHIQQEDQTTEMQVPTIHAIKAIGTELQKLQRGQAVTQYFFKLLADQNKDLLVSSKKVIGHSEEIIEGISKLEDLIEGFEEDHQLMESIKQFQDFLAAKMQQIKESGGYGEVLNVENEG